MKDLDAPREELHCDGYRELELGMTALVQRTGAKQLAPTVERAATTCESRGSHAAC